MNQISYSPQKLSRRKKVFFSTAGFFLVLLSLEILFRVMDWFEPTPMFETFTEPSGGVMVRFNLNAQKPVFRRDKEPGVYRILVVGESTALGFPFQPLSSFGLRLQSLLTQAGAGRVEIINLSAMGLYSEEVAEILKAGLVFEPDLVIVYCGQNEFISLLRRTPLGVIGRIPLPSTPALGRLRLTQVIARVVVAMSGAWSQMVMKSEQGGIELPPPSPLSPAETEKAKAVFRHSLEAMIAACQAQGVPLIISTMAVNLRDWPPDHRSVPKGLSQTAVRQALAALQQAHALNQQGRFQETVSLLEKMREQVPGYGLVSFELGRARTRLVEEILQKQKISGDGDEMLELQTLRALARADLQRALAEESAIVKSSRAPPEVNRVIRELAPRPGVFLLDAERIFTEVSAVAPGFDWFEDHCHPTLAGQQLLAERLFQLLKENKLGPVLKDSAIGWNEEDFRKKQGIDNRFLYDVFIRMGVYLGLEKALPEKSLATQDRLRLALAADPQNPFPAMCAALVALANGEEALASSLLLPWYPAREEALVKSLRRYFTPRVDLRQGVFMAELHEDPFSPPLRGLLKTGLFSSEKGKEKSVADLPPLETYNIFLDLERGGENITPLMKKKLAERARLKKRPLPPIVLLDPKHDSLLQPGPAVKLRKAGDAVLYVVERNDALLVSQPIDLDPQDYNLLVLEGRYLKGSSQLRLGWVYLDPSHRLATAEASLELKGGVDLDHYLLDLSRQPRWVMALKIKDLRFFPAGDLELRRVVLVNE